MKFVRKLFGFSAVLLILVLAFMVLSKCSNPHDAPKAPAKTWDNHAVVTKIEQDQSSGSWYAWVTMSDSQNVRCAFGLPDDVNDVVVGQTVGVNFTRGNGGSYTNCELIYPHPEEYGYGNS